MLHIRAEVINRHLDFILQQHREQLLVRNARAVRGNRPSIHDQHRAAVGRDVYDDVSGSRRQGLATRRANHHAENAKDEQRERGSQTYVVAAVHCW